MFDIFFCFDCFFLMDVLQYKDITVKNGGGILFSRNATKSIILFCLMIFTFGLIGCSNLFSLTPFGNVIFSFKLPSHLQTSRGGETSYTLRVSLHEKNDAVFQSVEKIIGGGRRTNSNFFSCRYN